MEPREVEIEVWKNSLGEWIVSLDDVVITICLHEITARQAAERIKVMNIGINFIEIG